MMFETLPAIPLKLEEFPHITEDEYKRLLMSIQSDDKKLMTVILWHLGLRISEVLNLTANDLIKKQDGYYIRIKRLKKRKETIDNIPIPVELANAIEKYIVMKGIKPDEKLFKMTRINAFEFYRRLGKKILGRSIHPHMFRHGRVYQLIKQGVPALLIVKLLGWSSLSVVLRYYHPTPDDIREVLKK
uniref:Tyr recombinase domain-containing protein n=1 Tax=candidate division WOR-3 bacterium TaxID=2052148 RepID=A0A7V3ZTF4_UNCW3